MCIVQNDEKKVYLTHKSMTFLNSHSELILGLYCVKKLKIEYDGGMSFLMQCESDSKLEHLYFTFIVPVCDPLFLRQYHDDRECNVIHHMRV